MVNCKQISSDKVFSMLEFSILCQICKICMHVMCKLNLFIAIYELVVVFI